MAIDKNSEFFMQTQTSRSQDSKSNVAGIFGLLALVGILSFALMFIFPKSGFRPLAITGKSLFPAGLFVLAFAFVAIALVSTIKKMLKFSKEIPRQLESLGVQFAPRTSAIYSTRTGIYKAIKLEFALRVAKKGSPDCYILTMFHPHRLNLGLVCTNGGQPLFGRQITLPYYKSFGSKKIELPENPKSSLKCWAANQRSARELFVNDGIKTLLISLSEILKRFDARFVLNDNSLKMAFGVDTIIDNTVLDAAKTLIGAITQSGKIPLNPPAKSWTEKIFQFAIVGIMIAFIAVITLIIINP